VRFQARFNSHPAGARRSSLPWVKPRVACSENESNVLISVLAGGLIAHSMNEANVQIFVDAD
jgi:hypothetical protein